MHAQLRDEKLYIRFVALIEGAGISLQTIDVRAIFERNGGKLALHNTC